MKHIRMRTIAVFAVAGLAGALLLRTSQSVQIAEDKLSALQTSLQQEKDSIQLLNAEWAYLNNPERLERLNREYLALMPPQPAAIMTGPDSIPAKFEEVPPKILGEISAMEPQPVSLQAKPPAKPAPKATPAPQPSPIKSKPSSDKDFTALLKNIQKGGPR
jgi:hypothetical protein